MIQFMDVGSGIVSTVQDEERKLRNALPWPMPQSFADAHCSSAVQ